MALAIDELARRLPRLSRKVLFLISDPAKPEDRVGPRHLQTCRFWGDQRHTTVRWVNGEMNILDVLSRDRDGNVTD
jgi:hypothetical protein